MITQSQVQSLFDYRDGNLYWKVSTGCVRVGQRAGGFTDDGYKNVRICGHLNKQHRVIFLYHHGYLPVEVDHIDGNGLNNRIKNLRPAKHAENMRNSKVSIDNTSGVKGVGWHKQGQKWRARVALDGKRHNLGLFDNKLDAAAAVFSARNKLHGEFARHG